jgi:hypothetical protein
MNYFVSTNAKNMFDVIESKQDTGEECVIATFASREDARAQSRILNLGGGFDGWTPNFFLTKTNNVGDLN